MRVFPILFIISAGFLVVLSSVFYNNIAERQSTTHVIELRENGFYPAKLTIQKGDAVNFITTGGKPFWPASNLHPTHGIYPEFDPQKPIEPEESWIFRFDQVGEWKYHNHLVSPYKGTIIVIGENGAGGDKRIKGECENLAGSQQAQCWEELMEETLKESGVGAAFDVLDNLYVSEPRFAASCHGYTHLIGEEAYRLFAADQHMLLTAKTSYCGYGFYHGFMETLLYTTGDIKKAQEFCVYVDQELGSTTSYAGERACYHGIGHGAIDASDPRAWGDAQAIIEPGLQLCEMVGETERQLFLCGNGVFNALANMFTDSKYELSLNRSDPFWICKLQSKPYFKKSCYSQMTGVIPYLVDYNFLESLKFVETITEEEYISHTIRSLAQLAASFHSQEHNYSDVVFDCRTLEKYLHTYCMGGFAVGIMEFGPPEVEYVDAMNFCQKELLTEEEQQFCLRRIFSRASGYYSPEKYLGICAATDEKYRATCLRFAPIL